MANHRRLGIRERLPMAGAAGLCALLASVPASAQASLDQRYQEGFALDVFEPAPVGDRFFGTPDASSYTDEKLRVGLVGDYPTRWVLRRTDTSTTGPTVGQTANVVSSQLYLHAGAAYPITDWLHAHVDIPFAAVQKGDTQASPSGGKFGDVRLGARANVVDSGTESFAFGPGLDVWLPTGSPDNLTGDGKARANARLGASGRAGAFVYSANLGYLVRKKLYTQSLETGDAVTFGAGAGVVLFDALQVGPEIWGNHQVNRKGTDTEVTPLTALFGARVQVGDFSLGAAVGPGLSTAPGVAPRLVVGVLLAPETHVSVQGEAHAADELPKTSAVRAAAADADGDGVADDQDACPGQAGDPAQNGCPAPRPVDVDSDGDGVPDKADACPHDAGDAAQNGCAKPEEVRAAEPPPKAKGAPSDTASVTFAGFHVFADGASRIYVQLSATVVVEAKISGTKAEYVLHGARIPIRNNKNPLLTGHFSAQVVSARLVPVGEPRKKHRGKAEAPSDVLLVVEMREAAHPEHRIVRNVDGTATLFVDFAKPSKPPPPEPDPVPPPPKVSEVGEPGR